MSSGKPQRPPGRSKGYRIAIILLALGVFAVSELSFLDSLLYDRADKESAHHRSTPLLQNCSSLSLVSSDDSASHLGSAATGTLFSGDSIRKYTGEWKLQSPVSRLRKSKSNAAVATHNDCIKWAVVTTIFAPSEAVKVTARLHEWCMVIVGDTQTPKDYLKLAGLDNRTDVVFLSIDTQRELDDDFVRLMPVRSFARKNIGYLYAIRHGARVVFDFDDDNILKPSNELEPLSPFVEAPPFAGEATMMARFFSTSFENGIAFNPLPLMGPSVPGPCWPRGFPLEHIKNSTMHGANSDIQIGTIPIASVGVIQLTADHDPDVDAVYRLTRPLPINFDNTARSLT
jgi:hypothetical protein